MNKHSSYSPPTEFPNFDYITISTEKSSPIQSPPFAIPTSPTLLSDPSAEASNSSPSEPVISLTPGLRRSEHPQQTYTILRDFHYGQVGILLHLHFQDNHQLSGQVINIHSQTSFPIRHSYLPIVHLSTPFPPLLNLSS